MNWYIINQMGAKITVFVFHHWPHNPALTLYHTIPTFNNLKQEAFENIMGKGENAGKEKQVSKFISHLIFHLKLLSI